MIDPTALPQISAPLPWHEQEWALLNQQLAEGQLPHALLLTGRQHTGKSQLAIALARLLLCAHIEGSLNCGKCHACALSASGGHGDFRWVTPGEKSRVIKIEQVRDLVRFTSKTAGFGLRKVIVIQPADSMNVNAFNALLKSLEEPARETFIILVCDHLYTVPATIRSRCRILRLATPDTEASLKWLDGTTGQCDRSRELLTLSDGLPLLARDLYCSGGADELAGKRLGLEALLDGRITVHQACALWAETEMGIFLEDLIGDLQRLVVSLSQERLRTRQARELYALLDEATRLRRAVSAGANPNRPLLVEALLSKAHRQLGSDNPDSNIQTRIGEAGV